MRALDLHRETPMSDHTYQYFCGLIHRHSRIHLGPNKVALLTSRLSKRRRELGFQQWDEYVDWLEQNRSEEIETLIDLVSTNHTHFFRESVHFDILRRNLLIPLLQQSPTARQNLRCWSAACSSGEEAFSLAIELNEFAQQHQPDLNWHIEATDISHRALLKAQQGVYEISRLNLPDPSYLRKYFQKGTGPYEGFCKVKPELQQRVVFQRQNLFGEAFSISQPQHIVFCRNVLIYFEVDSQSQLIHRLHDVIEPGGFLIVGHSDSLLRIKHPFMSLGNGVYQRKAST